MPPPAPSARRLRQPLNGQPASILIAALDDLPVVMRMTVSDADDPAAAKRARWAWNSARLHRRRALGDCSDDHPDGLAILVCVRLRSLAPASVEQRLSGGHTGRRWCGLGATNARQRADGQRGLCPRQRPDICCSLSHLGSFALHQLVHIFAQLIDVPAQGRDGIRVRRGDNQSNTKGAHPPDGRCGPCVCMAGGTSGDWRGLYDRRQTDSQTMKLPRPLPQ